MICTHRIKTHPKLFAWYINTHHGKMVKDIIIKLLISLMGYKIEIEIVVEKIK